LKNKLMSRSFNRDRRRVGVRGVGDRRDADAGRERDADIPEDVRGAARRDVQREEDARAGGRRAGRVVERDLASPALGCG
jgi:hypothetical protein